MGDGVVEVVRIGVGDAVGIGVGNAVGDAVGSEVGDAVGDGCVGDAVESVNVHTSLRYPAKS